MLGSGRYPPGSRRSGRACPTHHTATAAPSASRRPEPTHRQRRSAGPKPSAGALAACRRHGAPQDVDQPGNRLAGAVRDVEGEAIIEFAEGLLHGLPPPAAPRSKALCHIGVAFSAATGPPFGGSCSTASAACSTFPTRSPAEFSPSFIVTAEPTGSFVRPLRAEVRRVPPSRRRSTVQAFRPVARSCPAT